MTILSPAVWSSGRRLARVRPAPAGDRRADVALRLRLGWAAAAGAAFAGLVAAMGAAFGDRPSAFAALVLATAMAIAALLLRGLTSGILLRLSAAVTEADALRAELASVRQTNEAFRDLAHHDSLTGLPNRSLLYDRLGVAIAHSHRQTSHLALLFLDLNDFKSVNDSFGHGFGDRLLVELANRIRGSVRAGDTVARLGGDEFVVLLDTVTGAEHAACVAAKVRHVVRAPFRLDGHEVPIAASIGMSVYPGDGTTADELMRSADAAMYRDKQREAELRAGAGSEEEYELEAPFPGLAPDELRIVHGARRLLLSRGQLRAANLLLVTKPRTSFKKLRLSLGQNPPERHACTLCGRVHHAKRVRIRAGRSPSDAASAGLEVPTSRSLWAPTRRI